MEVGKANLKTLFKGHISIKSNYDLCLAYIDETSGLKSTSDNLKSICTS